LVFGRDAEVMTTYIIRRLILATVVVFIVSIMVFFAMRFLPGDPIRMIITPSQSREYTEQQIAQLEHEFGLDKPLIVQYFSWISGIFHGDMGISIISRAPVSEEIFKCLPITLHLGISAFLLGAIIGIPAGIICAIKRGTFIDTLVTSLSNFGITIPVFWLGLMLIYLFALYLKWLPVMGYTSPFVDFAKSTKQLVMPVICLALFPIASNARQTRSSMLEVMRQDYIRTAWAKGLQERFVVIRHALKNGLIPVINLSGVALSMIIGGAVIIEQVFNIPGMGRLTLTAITNQDYPYVQGIILLIAVTVSLANLLVDLICGWLDPRVKYS
jgi:peptide/nickel transport system permease protein